MWVVSSIRLICSFESGDRMTFCPTLRAQEWNPAISINVYEIRVSVGYYGMATLIFGGLGDEASPYMLFRKDDF